MSQSANHPLNDPAIDKDYLEEIQAYRKEQERIRAVLAQIGKESGTMSDHLANVLFILGLASLVYIRFIGGWVDNILSLELGLLLVSFKIIWMMRMQTRYNHFLFWIVHSIEYRQGELLTRIDSLKASLEERDCRQGKPE